MSILSINAGSVFPKAIRIGYEGENVVTQIDFNLEKWIAEYGLGGVTLLVLRHGDTDAYPVPLIIKDGIASWSITEVDTAKVGRGAIQLVYTVGEKIKKSPILDISCLNALDDSDTVPDPYDSWLATLTDLSTLVTAKAAESLVNADVARAAKDDAQVSKTAAATSASQASASASSASASASQSALSAQTAQTAETGATESAQTASTKASEATASAQSAASSAQTATDKATLATNKAQAASESASIANEAKTVAITNAHLSVTKADEARNSATRAANSATSAQEYDESAQQSAVNAQTAQGLAESARDSAITAKNDAESARDDAETARDEAVQAVASISGALDDKAPVITDTASGSIASFTDGADGLPLKSLIVDINPIQDLSNGDPSPENICPISGWTGCNVNANGTVIPISWQTEAGTVYGGSLDVLSGVLTVDMTIADMGTLNWMYYPNKQRIVAQVNSGKPAVANVGLDGACSVYKVVNTKYSNMPDKSVLIGNNFISNAFAAMVVFDSAYTDAKTFKTAVSGQMLVFPIKNPIVYQLTPTEVKSLLGQNNIWADTGDTEVEYRADTKLYIERLTEPDADMIADSNIVSGQYFMVGNNLYKATANIASGASVIVGTNCTQKSLATALNEINQ